jgi:hypothetical protein
MLKTLEAERTENAKALSVAFGNGGNAQGLQTAQVLYRQIAALASALGRIERELRDSQAWLHDGLCDCAHRACTSCAASASSLKRAIGCSLSWTRSTLLSLDADVETECLRCAQPFTPVDDEQLCEACQLAEYGPRR